jgi:hypothetical protein
MTFWQSRYNPQLKLSQQDLIDISEEITQAYAPDNSYVQSELVLMPVDPVTLHAYWNIQNNSTSATDTELILRVYSEPTLSEHSSHLRLSFDIKLSSFQGQQTVAAPIAATAYSAVIGTINADSSFSVLATSEIIHVPRESPALTHKTVLNAPNIDPVSVNVSAGDEHTYVMEQKKTSEHSISNSEQPIQKVPMFDHLFATEINNTPDVIYVPRESAQFESNSNAAKNQHTSTNTNTALNTEPFILKNFNNQGYDLKVYANNSDSEFADLLAKQVYGFYIIPNKTTTTKQNSSGLGFYL